MNKKILISIGVGAVALLYSLNLSYAIDNYGILKNTLSLDVLAQTSSTSGGGSSSGGGSGSSSSGGGGGSVPCSELPNNANGGNIYLYCDKGGDPKECTLHRYIGVGGSLGWTEDGGNTELRYTGEKTEGVKELCGTTGNGCTVYSCHATNNTNP